MKFIYLMDPLETVIFEKDTTFMLMHGAHKRNHETYVVYKDGLSLIEGKLFFHAIKVTPQLLKDKPFIIEHHVRISQDDIHAVFVRFDPPFDDKYLMTTWLLDLLPKHIPIINKPSGIRTVNEKVWASQLTSLTPPTIISSHKHDLLAFIEKHQQIIAKPSNAFGGQSVFKIEYKNTNTHVILETLSDRYTKNIILQRYIPEAQLGDKRILLLNGNVLGSLLRVHGEGDHRNNFYAGGKPAPTTLTARDQEIIVTLKPYLQQLGLHFVGIDILGDYLIEVNVTSPTCLQEMNRLYNMNLESTVIEYVESLCRN